MSKPKLIVHVDNMQAVVFAAIALVIAIVIAWATD
jgi:hypothetical protein